MDELRVRRSETETVETPAQRVFPKDVDVWIEDEEEEDEEEEDSSFFSKAKTEEDAVARLSLQESSSSWTWLSRRRFVV